MFDFGWAELIVIMAVAVLVIGPSDIPRVMFGFGRLMRRMQHIRYAITRQFDDVMHEVDLAEIRKYNEDRARTAPDTDEAEADEDVVAAIPFKGKDADDDAPKSGGAAS